MPHIVGTPHHHLTQIQCFVKELEMRLNERRNYNGAPGEPLTHCLGDMTRGLRDNIGVGLVFGDVHENVVMVVMVKLLNI